MPARYSGDICETRPLPGLRQHLVALDYIASSAYIPLVPPSLPLGKTFRGAPPPLPPFPCCRPYCLCLLVSPPSTPSTSTSIYYVYSIYLTSSARKSPPICLPHFLYVRSCLLLISNLFPLPVCLFIFVFFHMILTAFDVSRLLSLVSRMCMCPSLLHSLTKVSLLARSPCQHLHQYLASISRI